MSPFEQLQRDISHFSEERGWAKFHSPKNLAMAIAGEAGELVAEFQWLTEGESREAGRDSVVRTAARLEAADVLIYLIQFAASSDFDLLEAASEKLAINASRFPVAETRGGA
jgi:dCTP diphosphatase